VPRPIESIKANASEDDGTLYSKTSSQRCSEAEESEVRKSTSDVNRTLMGSMSCVNCGIL